MITIVAFFVGVVIGFIGSWFVWKNNKRKWDAVEARLNISKRYISDMENVANDFAGNKAKNFYKNSKKTGSSK